MLENSQLIGFGSGGGAGELHLYWRLNFPNGSAQTTTLITEATMSATAGGADQCSGGTASANSSNGSYTPDKAFDNSTSTFWNSSNDGACWLQYQFTSPVKVDEFTLSVHAFVPNCGPSDIELQYSDDGAAFTTLDTFSAGAWATVETKTFTVTP